MGTVEGMEIAKGVKLPRGLITVNIGRAPGL